MELLYAISEILKALAWRPGLRWQEAKLMLIIYKASTTQEIGSVAVCRA